MHKQANPEPCSFPLIVGQGGCQIAVLRNNGCGSAKVNAVTGVVIQLPELPVVTTVTQQACRVAVR